MQKRLKMVFLGALLSAAGAVLAQEESEEALTFADEEVRTHAVDALPDVVLGRARAAAPDVFFQSAESYWEDDFRVYRLSGRLFREVWNVYVREDGKLLRTESDNQDD